MTVSNGILHLESMIRKCFGNFGLPALFLLNLLLLAHFHYFYYWPCFILRSQFAVMRRDLITTTQRLSAHNVPHILYEGTLLGLVRDGDIIPWDSDVDVAILGPFDERFKKFLEDPLLLEEMVPVLKSSGWALYSKSRFNQSDFMRVLYKRVYIDIMSVPLDHEKEVTQDGKTSLFSVWGTKFPVPANVDRALSFMYGPTFMVPDRNNDRGCGFNTFPQICTYVMKKLMQTLFVAGVASAIASRVWPFLVDNKLWRGIVMFNMAFGTFLVLIATFFLLTEFSYASGRSLKP